MKLTKENLVKYITSPKVVERLIRQGWSTDEVKEIAPTIKRGRPAKKEV
jgi:hypothetical protein